MLFQYKGFDGNGKMYDGFLIADDKDIAISSLKKDKNIIALVTIKRKINSPIINGFREEMHNQKKSFFKRIDNRKEIKRNKELKKREKIKSGKTESFSIKEILEKYRDKAKKLLLLQNKSKGPKTSKKEKIPGTVSYLDEKEAFSNDSDYVLEDEYYILESKKANNRHLEDGGTIDWDELIPDSNDIEIKKNKRIRIKEKEIVLFTKQLTMMLDSGVSLLRSLEILRDSSSKRLGKVINSIMDLIQKGTSLSIAMSKYPKQFDSLYVSMVSIGETSGRLTKSLADITYYKEKSSKIRKKVKSASIYPVAVGIVLSVLLIIGSVYFIPIFKKMFEDQNLELPKLTSIVFSIADKIPAITLTVVVLITIVHILKKTSKTFNIILRSFSDLILLRFPILKSVFNANNMFIFASSTALMLENGIRLKDALELTKRSINNVYIKHQIDESIALMVRGHSFSEAISKQSHFDRLLTSVLITGEESGKMGNALREISNYYDEELNKQVSILMESIQPAFIILIAIIVIPVIVSIYLPIIDISSGTTMGF